MAQQSQEGRTSETLIDGIVRNIVSKGGSRTVYGEPVTSGDRTIIPVAKVSYWFGLGYGSGTGPQIGDDGTVPGGEGGGGGGKLNARPVGYIESSASGSRYVPVIDWSGLLRILLTFVGVGVTLVLWGASRAKRREG